VEPPTRWTGSDSRLHRSQAIGVAATLAVLWLAVLWSALGGHDRRIGATIAALGLLVAAAALHAWIRRSRLTAALALWTASLSLCAAASVPDLAGLGDSTRIAGAHTLRSWRCFPAISRHRGCVAAWPWCLQPALRSRS